MPAALDVNWTEVQMLALTVGVREAARQMGISEDAVRMRSSREGWIKERAASVPLPPTMKQPVTVVTSAAEAFKNALTERGNKSRLALAKGLGAAADCIAEMPGEQVLANSQDVKNVVGSLSTVHAWGEQGAMIKMNLNVTGTNASNPGAGNAQTLDAEIVQDVQGEELP